MSPATYFQFIIIIRSILPVLKEAIWVPSSFLPPRYVAQVASALEKTRKPVLVWLQFQDCAGNSEAILRSSNPPVLDVVLDL